MATRTLIALGLLLISWGAYSQQLAPQLPKQPASLLREDLQLLKKILEANHPSLYWYTPQQTLDSFFSVAMDQVKDSMNEVSFRNTVAAYVSKIQCGHTAVRNSKSFTKKYSRQLSMSIRFPLNLKLWDDSMVVLSSLRPRDSVFVRGTKILQINQKTGRQFIDTISQFISGDGPGSRYATQQISGNFGTFYKNILGLDSLYAISFLNRAGKRVDTLITNVSPSALTFLPKDSINKKPSVKLPSKKEIRKIQKAEQRMLQIDTLTRTAFIRLGSFSGSGTSRFIRSSFRKIKKANAENLVIDLRTNGGGKVSNSTLLTRYLSDHRFKVADSVVRNNKALSNSRYINSAWVYSLGLLFSGKKLDDGKYHFTQFETKQWKPIKKNHFEGRVYLVQGGYSFSAATLFLGEMKGQQNVKLVGEETGGGYYGNSAMLITYCTLPNSKLRVSLPLYRLVINKNRPKGGGVLPDIYVPPSSAAIERGVDLKMEKIKSLIQR